jgi:acetyl/propionyl-CoA carboxylase alpha subunit/acetyl-CoA carboxylase carboxyltransferase component
MATTFSRVLIVNRGDPAVRFLQAVRDFNRLHGTAIETVAIHAHGGRARFVREADRDLDLRTVGPATVAPSRRYLDHETLEQALRLTGADAAWVGWGFISEQPDFVDLCARLGVTFIGPPSAAMRLLGDKVSAKRLATQLGIAVTPWGGEPADSIEHAAEQAGTLGYPVVVKPANGAGGRGIRVATRPEELAAAYTASRDEARRLFGDGTVFVERWLPGARHIEVQTATDRGGTTWAIDVRDCSVQRRHQKILEESPARDLPPEVERGIRAAAVTLCRAASYQNLATFEFLFDPAEGAARLMEVNPRLQVEHGVTELTTGIDLVQLQLHLARGGRLAGAPPVVQGHAAEVRLNAEDAEAGFGAAPGRLHRVDVPTRSGLRLDLGADQGDQIRPEYDSMFARLLAHAPTREEALARLADALADSIVVVDGGLSNRAFLAHLVGQPALHGAPVSTSWLDGLAREGQHVSRAGADLALLVAAVEVYESDLAALRDEFLASAQRLRPATVREIGRTVELRLRGRRYTMRVFRLGARRFRVTVDGMRVELTSEVIGEHERLVTYAGRRQRVFVVPQGPGLIVETAGAVHRISRDEVGVVRAWAPAVVVSLGVAKGDTVAAGQPVGLLEAMKMEMPVLAPCDGTVREVLVLQNALVGAGTALLRIDAAEPDAAAAAGEPVAFAGEKLPTPATGKPVSRASALATGVTAFAEALTPPDRAAAFAVLDHLAEVVLGGDLEPAEVTRLVDEYRRFAGRIPIGDREWTAREDEILHTFADVAALFRQAPGEEEEDPSALSAGQYFLTYLRTLEARGADLPAAFVAELQRALAHFGSGSLEVTPDLRTRLFRLWLAHQRVNQGAAAAAAILEHRARHAAELAPEAGERFLALLDRLVSAGEGQLPTLVDLARDVRYRFYEQPAFERDRRALIADMEAHLGHLMREPAAEDRARRIEALVECPVPLAGLMSGRFEPAAPVLREVMLEVLTRRAYRIRALEDLRATEVEGHSVLSARYAHEGRHIRLWATHATWDDMAGALRRVRDLQAGTDEADDRVVDLYVARAGDGDSADAMAATLGDLLNAAGFPHPVRRTVVAVSGPRAEWSTSSTSFFAYRMRDGRFEEDRRSRGLHPMVAKRLQLWRLAQFDLERLPADDDVYVFHGVARQNAKDQRFFALAEVHDVSTVRGGSGTLLRVPHLERVVLECLAAIREAQLARPGDDRLYWNRVVVDVRPRLTLDRGDLVAVMRRLAAGCDGLGLEKIVLRGEMRDPATGEFRPMVLNLPNPGGHGIALYFEPAHDRALAPLDEYTQKVVRMRQRGLHYPYEIVRLLTPGRVGMAADLPPGDFREHDLDADGRLVPVDRPWGRNTANIVAGVIRSFTPKYPEGMTRVALLGDASREMGSLAEPECRRILAALDLAESLGVPLEWFALSAGAKISMESGTENMDWIGRVLRRIIEFTQAGREINIVVTGINVGAQPYWNAEATMLMHTRGILVMLPESAMVLTGKTALDYSGSVSAEDNIGIGGYERIMGPNGQAQYWARDISEACQILLRYYDHTYRVSAERFPRRAATTDPIDRDVCLFPHGPIEGADFRVVGDVFSDATNPGRKKPFDIRRIMLAVADQDATPLERWAGMRDAEIGVVWDAHVGGWPVCLLGFESRSLPRLGFVPTDGPERWTSGTLFPMASKKIARAINAASGNRPLVVLANLSGFDGSPESMRRRQLEFGAEIGRAVTNFAGPIIFLVISRYHGGAFVVFSRTLHDNMQVAALEGTYASVIGGAPAAAVVFAREVDARTRKDPRVAALEQDIAAADDEARRRLRPRLAALVKSVRSERLGEVADEFDHIHSVHRALQVGSLDHIIPPARLRPFIVEALEIGMARDRDQRRRPGGLGARDQGPAPVATD